MHKILSLSLLTLYCALIQAQSPDDRNKHGAGFLHSDRTVYAPGETCWESFFSLNDLSGVQGLIDSPMQTLYLSLIDPYRHRVVLTRRFAMSGGIAAGTVPLPDTLTEGRYTFAAFPGKYLRGGVIAIATRDIFVHSLAGQPVTFLAVDDRTVADKDSISVAYFLYTKDKGAAGHLSVNYRYYEDSVEVLKGTAVSSSLGEVKIKVPYRADGRRRELYLETHEPGESRAAFAIRDPHGVPLLRCKADVKGDSLRLLVGPLEPRRRYRSYVLHQADTLYSCDFVMVKSEARFSLPIDSLIAGTAWVTVVLCDSAGKDIARQSIFREVVSPAISITPDSSIYPTRGQVKVKLRCMAQDGSLLSGQVVVSVSSLRKCQPGEAGVAQSYYCPRTVSVGEIRDANPEFMQGAVIRQGRARRQNIPVLVMGGETYQLTNADSAGHFRLPLSSLVTGATDKLLVAVSGKYADNCELLIKEPDRDIHASLAKMFFPSQFVLQDDDLDSASSLEEKKLFQRTLKAVVVKAVVEPGQDNSLVGRHRHKWSHLVNYGSMNVQYCGLCHLCRKGIRGGYEYWELWTGKRIYAVTDKDAVTAHSRLVQPFLPPQAMPVMDYRAYPGEELHATVYFNPFVQLDEKGEAELTFFTSDTKGKLQIEVNGVAGGYPVHAQSLIQVR